MIGDLSQLSLEELSAKIIACHSRCTLEQKVGDEDKEQKVGDEEKEQKVDNSGEEKTWLRLCKEQSKQNRIPGL